MKGLMTLVLMQLRDKLDLSQLKTIKAKIFKVVLSILKFAAITAVFFLSFYVLEMLSLVSFLPGIPTEFFSVLFTIMLLMSILFCTFGLMKNLYYTKDNALLLTLPAGRTTVLEAALRAALIFSSFLTSRNMLLTTTSTVTF